MIVVDEGSSPLVLCLPHCGTDVPPVVGKRFNATGRLQTDLSWRLDEVMRFGPDLGATLIRSTISRYVIDLDRDPETPRSLAADPAKALCPVTTLDGKRLYKDGEEPGGTEIEQRILLFSTPFLRAVHQQVDRLLRLHKKVVLIDCQSMRSHIKGVTDKGLPVVSIGSADGSSCDTDLRSLLVGSFKSQEGYTVGVDHLAKGGFLTRTFGRPEQGLHAMTLLIAQRAYLRHESPPFEPDKSRVLRLRALMEDSFSRVIDWANMDASVLPASGPEDRDLPEPPVDAQVTDAEGPQDGTPADNNTPQSSKSSGQSPSMLQVAE